MQANEEAQNHDHQGIIENSELPDLDQTPDATKEIIVSTDKEDHTADYLPEPKYE